MHLCVHALSYCARMPPPTEVWVDLGLLSKTDRSPGDLASLRESIESYASFAHGKPFDLTYRLGDRYVLIDVQARAGIAAESGIKAGFLCSDAVHVHCSTVPAPQLPWPKFASPAGSTTASTASPGAGTTASTATPGAGASATTGTGTRLRALLEREAPLLRLVAHELHGPRRLLGRKRAHYPVAA